MISVGRSGSTLLQRVLNTSPDLQIWGEHGGLVRSLVEAYRLGAVVPDHRRNLDAGYAARELVLAPMDDQPGGAAEDAPPFRPWVSPFDGNTLRLEIADTITRLFGTHSPEGVRWGFKEIRYDSNDLRHLLELFPEADLVVLVRDLRSTIRSDFFAFGRPNFDWEGPGGRERVLDDLSRRARVWVRRNGDLVRFCSRSAERRIVLPFDAVASNTPQLASLFTHLQVTPPSPADVADVLATRSGSSFAEPHPAEALVEDCMAQLDVDHGRAEEIWERVTRV